MRTSTLVTLAFALGIVALVPLASDDALVYQYVGGAYQIRGSFSVGGVCTGAEEPTPDGSTIHVPVVVGGVCAVPLGESTRVAIAVEDVAWNEVPPPIGPVTMPFRYEFWGGSAPHVTCSSSEAAWGTIELAVPSGCERISVYLSDIATTGTIRVARSWPACSASESVAAVTRTP